VKSELVSGVSHELRTPLAQIRMFAEMLRLGWVRSDDERQRSVAIIDQEARRLSHLVENILQFSRAERLAPRLSVAPLELTALVNEVVESFAPLAAARGVTVRTTHSGGRLGARRSGRASSGAAQSVGQRGEVRAGRTDHHSRNARCGRRARAGVGR
jgi:signal transduction histidine kinase